MAIIGIGGLEILILFVTPLLLWVVSLLHLMQSQQDGTYKLTWAIIIVFLPVLGAILYFVAGLFGINRSQ